MSEEVRFFLRIALYTFLIATIYWFVSYEHAGTTLLVFLGAAAVFFASFVLLKSERKEVKGGRGPLGFLKRTLGFDEPDDAQGPLATEEEAVDATIWPLGAALGATLVALGLVFGPWLWIPGLGLTIASATAWLTDSA